ncbi:hypothetical protein DFJ58DRAFT_714926 [Suillus subalutaceus]|uniref:uncharacterized protein n=1 Tax=Suillus subalutaceus TaxID=48586 RepID=UPI001B8624C9|nr:uncharacterized protein DFJ58DRAFT_714926 [Suillus subalutaceus]KAG1864763.1 hypothetical protein DFJ58DRAFT_714926 [Suillus subalutaceus]
MCIAHFAPGLSAKPFQGYRCGCSHLQGHFQIGVMESFVVDKGLMSRRYFPSYAIDYPFSHSLFGMAYVLVAERKMVSIKDGAVLRLLAVTLSHFRLEIPSHRQDIKITPSHSTHLGSGTSKCALFFGGLWVYRTFAPIATRLGYKRHPARLWGVAAILLVQQPHFYFGAAPSTKYGD